MPQRPAPHAPSKEKGGWARARSRFSMWSTPLLITSSGTVAKALSGQCRQLHILVEIIRSYDHCRASVARNSEVHEWDVLAM